ncbi:MAG: lipid-A-disaccharide synthase [Syntrophobacterales bacterium]|nr:lipid-A-disaccharide synthase [Syntrophobacterales bacterium]
MDILISTGDLSGEIYGVEILGRLRKVFPTVNFFSLTKGILSKAGAIPISPITNIGVVGITEVITQAKNLWKLLQCLQSFFERSTPKVVILIDFPDMNLHIVARMAKRRGARVLYFIPPQVWAWRPSRIKLLKKLTDSLIVILPFEESFYKRANIKEVVYFGHPLVDRVSLNRFPTLETEKSLTIGLFPGSRISEWNHHIPIVNEVVSQLRSLYSEARFLLAVAPGMEKLVSSFELSHYIELIFGSELETATEGVLKRCHLALMASGTVTLEAALLGVPMIVFYKVSPLSALITRKLIKIPFGSLPNIIVGEYIVPEFIEFIRHFEPEDLLRATKHLIEDFYLFKNNQHLHDSAWQKQKVALTKVKESLGTPPVMERIADYILSFITR